MKTRRFTKEDYDVVCSWWEGQGWPNIPMESLPHTGRIVEGVCAGFLYKTDSNIAWLEWIVANKFTDAPSRQAGLQMLIKDLVADADAWGAKLIFTSLNHQGLMEKFGNEGFTVAEVGMTNMLRRK